MFTSTNEAATFAATFKSLAEPPPPGSPYALPLPGTERENRTAIYRNWRVKDRELFSTFDPSVATVHDLFESAVRRRPGANCLGTRPWNAASRTWEPRYEWLSYTDVAGRRSRIGSGLVEIHRRIGIDGAGYGVGLWSQNRAEWMITDLAAASQSLYTVSLYETLGVETTEYIINHASLSCVVCSLPHVPTLLKLAPRCPTLKLIVSMDALDAGEEAGHSKLALLNQVAAQNGIQIYSLDGVEKIGETANHPVRPPRATDITTINYTSGTTGVPKGVVLTHANAIAGVAASLSSGEILHKDIGISYLPLAHIYGRMADQAALAQGSAVGFFHGNILELVDDMKILGPTGLMSVPRLYNKFNAAIREATIKADGFKGALSRRVVETKKALMKQPAGKASNTHILYDRIWTPKVRAALGLQHCHSMVSGSAPLDPDVHEFLRAALGIKFVQGYGLTESYAVTSFQLRGDYSLGNIGPPVAMVEVCLESLPELEYLVTDKPNPRGELLLRGPVIFSGYYRNEEETRKALDPDGWFHTGDIAELDDMGRIKIVDRKKNVLKLSQGEYISPERIENVYMGSSNLITMAYVHGDPTQSALVAVFGVEPVNFSAFAAKVLNKAIDPADLDAVRAAAADPRVRKAFVKRLDDIGRKHKFNSYERVRSCHLAIDPFSIDNDLLTPTLKLKRPQTAKAFRSEITKMYEEVTKESESKAKL